MTPQSTSASEVVSFEDLRTLATGEGPCISMAVPIPNPLEIRTYLKNAVRELARRMSEQGIDSGTADVLVGPIHTLAASALAEREWSRDLVIFRSPGIFRHFLRPARLKEFVQVSDRFQIRPLLSALSREQQFYLLALCQKQVRLFWCTDRNARGLAGLAPENLQVWMNARMPDHVLSNRSTGGPSVGSMEGVMFGTSTDRERQGQYLAHFFKEVDSGVHRIVGNTSDPLMLAGVESEVAIYRRVSTHPRLIDDAVHGSPDGVTPTELHKHAMEIIGRTFSAPLRKLLAEFDEYRSARRVSSGIDAVLKAAYEGRISDLLVREDAERHGHWDQVRQQIQEGKEDLLNLAALATVSHGGRAFGLQAADMPEGVDAAAVLRFSS